MASLPHAFRDQSLLALALTHASLSAAPNNERLEFLGDAALDLVVAEELFKRHPDSPEGDLTERKARVVSRKSLAEAAQRLDLGALARLGPGFTERALPRSVLANLYEAVLGAVYLDGGLEAARAFALATLGDDLVRTNDDGTSDNPKQALQHLSQRLTGRPPEYVVLESRGEAHMRAFLVCAQVGERRFASAWGRTRKEAEAWAAHEALLVLDEAQSA